MNARDDSALPPVVNESGIAIKPLYTAQDVAASGGEGMIGRPGEYPFTRGIHPLMYRKRPWTMRQYTGFGSAADTNERFRYLIANGQTGLNVAFDLPTQIGLDSDDPLAEGEVGRVGMAVDTLRDFEIAFEGIDLDAITVSLTINGAAAILIAMYLAMAEKRGYDVRRLRGTAQNDILKEFIGRGTWVFPVEPSLRLVGDTIEYCAREAPKYTPVSVEDHEGAVRRTRSGVDAHAHDRRRRRQRPHLRAAGEQYRARRLLRADQRAFRRADDGAVLL